MVFDEILGKYNLSVYIFLYTLSIVLWFLHDQYLYMVENLNWKTSDINRRTENYTQKRLTEYYEVNKR